MSLHQVTPYDADDDPLTLDSVRDDHLRSPNGSAEDTYIQSLIDVSLGIAQQETQRTILPETWRLDLDGFPFCIELPLPPLIEVVSIQYYDEDDALQTVDAADYTVTAPFGPTAEAGYIELVDGESWPTTAVRPDAVKVTFRCGYVDGSVSPESVAVPAMVTHARLLIVKDLYEHRGSSSVGVGTSVTPNILTAQKLLWPFRIHTAAG